MPRSPPRASVTLDTAGPIGTASSRIQFDATGDARRDHHRVGVVQPTGAYLDGSGQPEPRQRQHEQRPAGRHRPGQSGGACRRNARHRHGTLSLAADVPGRRHGRQRCRHADHSGQRQRLCRDSITLRGADDEHRSDGQRGQSPPSAARVSHHAGRHRRQCGSSDGTGSAASFYCPDGRGGGQRGQRLRGRLRQRRDPQDHARRRGHHPGRLRRQTGSADGTGSAARFDYPDGVAVDSAGNVYVADTGNDEIRKITPAGVVTTLAGTAGQAAPATAPAARHASIPRAWRWTARATSTWPIPTTTRSARSRPPAWSPPWPAPLGKQAPADGTGSAARFYEPTGVAVDSAGNVYVADTDNDEIRKITPAGVVTTLAGSAGQRGSSRWHGHRGTLL